MPYAVVLNHADSISSRDGRQLRIELDALRAELNDIRTKYAAVLAKLDADVGVTDTNYAATAALATSTFTAT